VLKLFKSKKRECFEVTSGEYFKTFNLIALLKSTEEKIKLTIETDEKFTAKFKRTGFRKTCFSS
jgi:hypothetical protein